MAQHPGSIWIDKNWNISWPNNMYIAADSNGIRSENRDYDQLIASLRTRQISLQEVTIAFIITDIVQ